MRSYHAQFYIPIILLWGSVTLSAMNPVLIQSDISFDSDIQRGDLLRIDPGGDVARDDLIVYRPARVAYVARVIGVPGDEITLGLDGNSIIRNGERIVLAPRGFEISMNGSGIMSVEDGEVAVYVHNARRNPVTVTIGGDTVRGPVDKIYRYADLGRSDWLTIGFDSLIVLVLILLPYAAFVRQRSRSFPQLVTLVSHTFLSLVLAAALLAVTLPGDPMRLGAADPIWWWFPLVVVSGFSGNLLLVVALFLAVQWLRLRRHGRHGDKGTDDDRVVTG